MVGIRKSLHLLSVQWNSHFGCAISVPFLVNFRATSGLISIPCTWLAIVHYKPSLMVCSVEHPLIFCSRPVVFKQVPVKRAGRVNFFDAYRMYIHCIYCVSRAFSAIANAMAVHWGGRWPVPECWTGSAETRDWERKRKWKSFQEKMVSIIYTVCIHWLHVQCTYVYVHVHTYMYKQSLTCIYIHRTLQCTKKERERNKTCTITYIHVHEHMYTCIIHII